MKERKGLIIVPVEHELQSALAAESIYRRVNSIIAKTQEATGMQEKILAFKITAYSNSRKSNGQVLRSITGGKLDGDEVRLIYSDNKIEDASIKRYYESNTLMVALCQTDGYPHIHALKGATGCRIEIPQILAARLVEDIFLDIFMGRWLTGNASFAHLLSERNGMRGFFKQKVNFFKRNQVEGYIRTVSRKAGYAPLSTLNTCSDDDIVGRSNALIQTWKRFRSSLTVAAVVPTAANSRIRRATSTAGILDQLASIPIIGMQIPIARIISRSKKLPDGEYVLIIQRKSSSVRKSPKVRGWMTALFGQRSRINSFSFLNSSESNRLNNAIKNLEQSGYLYLLSVGIRSGALVFTS